MDRRIEIGTKSYRLRYTLNAMCEMERAAGCPLDRMVERQFTAARLLLWGALIGDEPDMTLTRAGELMDTYMATGSIEELLEACSLAMEDAGFFGQMPT